MSSESITLYAELLLSIRTITFFASLQSVHNRTTKATISADGTTITLAHEGASASIRLPTALSGGGSASLQLPAAPSKELRLRLALQEREPGFLRLNGENENIVPWCASSLGGSARICCASCGTDILKAGRIETWKDLPNENWAEMMDFWHCHKPDETHVHGKDVGSQKGYAASNKLKAVEGTGLVDLSYFLLAEKDCENIEVGKPPARESLSSTSSPLLCSTCTSTLGTVDSLASGYRLYKWGLSLSPKPETPLSTFSTQKWLSAQFLTLIENQGVRKFAIRRDGDDQSEPGLLLWVFTPDLKFSSSVDREARMDPTRAMKVFWKTLSQKREDGRLNAESLSVEDILLPELVFQELKTALQSSGRVLPKEARRFQEWDVGLLERFVPGAI